MKKLVISVLLVNLLVACASGKPKQAAVDEKPVPVAAVTQPAASSSSSSASAADVAVDPLGDPSNLLAKRSVYYAFDSNVVQDADKPVVQAHARYLAQNPGRSVRLEGNADERGSNEYNLALGQRRADAVKKMLMLGGVKDSQIEAASYGEEKPRASGHDEALWAQNRRTDLKYVK